MAEDCVCTNLYSIWSVLSEISTRLQTIHNDLNNIRINIGNVDTSIDNLVDSVDNLSQISDSIEGRPDYSNSLDYIGSRLETFRNYFSSGGAFYGLVSQVKTSVDGVSSSCNYIASQLRDDGLSLAQIMRLTDETYTEIVVESNNWAYVGKGEVGFSDS